MRGFYVIFGLRSPQRAPAPMEEALRNRSAGVKRARAVPFLKAEAVRGKERQRKESAETAVITRPVQIGRAHV